MRCQNHKLAAIDRLAEHRYEQEKAELKRATESFHAAA